MKRKRNSAISVIGGADGATNIFIPGKSKKQSLITRIRNIIHKYKWKRAERRIVANTHILAEVVEHARLNYELTETAPTKWEYMEQHKSLKGSLILQHKPEVLGEMKDIPVPDISDEISVKEYLSKIETRSEMIAKMPNSIIPMDFYLYKIRIDDSFLEIGVDFIWNIFEISYSGNKKSVKQFKKISKELYLYYGVSEKDIKYKTQRYSSLIAVLSS